MKKIVSLFLTMAILMSVFAGCTGGNGETSTPSETPVESGSTDATSETPVEQSADQWAPIGTPDKPVPVSIILKDVFSNEESTQQIVEVAEQKMASHGQYVDITWLDPPASDYPTALPLGIRSGSLYADIVYFQGGDLPISQEGLLEDLTPYIENSTYVKGMMNEANKARIANYPYLMYLSIPRVHIPVMRKDYAAQLETYDALIADPTPDNYYNFFKEMKDKGLVEYGFTMDGSLDRLNGIFNHAFGVNTTVIEEDGKYIFSMASQAEKAKLEYYAKLYADGLLDPTYVTEKWDGMEQKFYESKVGVVSSTAGDVVQIYDNKMTSVNGPEATLITLPPAKGVTQAYTSTDTTKEPRGFAIHVDCENKDAAFAVLEFFASPEGRVLEKLGIEGVHYEVKDNQIQLTDKFPEWWARVFPTPLNLEPEYPLAEPIITEVTQKSIDLVDEYYYEDINVIIPNDMAAQYDAMISLYKEYSTDIITGKAPIEKFDEFVIKFNEAGGTAFSEYFATELD